MPKYTKLKPFTGIVVHVQFLYRTNVCVYVHVGGWMRLAGGEELRVFSFCLCLCYLLMFKHPQ